MNKNLIKRILFGVSATVALGLSLLWKFSIPAPKGSEAQSIALQESQSKATNKQGRLKRPTAAVTGDHVKKFFVSDDGMVEVPTHYRLPGVDKVHTASNTVDWLQLYPAEYQERIKSFGERYHGIYEISSPQQIAWMSQSGFPMPEDIIAAETLSDTELRNLGKQGNDKAVFLLHDRTVSQLKGTLADVDMKTSDGMAIFLSLGSDDDVILRSRSPFKGYIEAFDAMRLFSDPLKQKSDLVSGLMRAYALGDTRAFDVLSNYNGLLNTGPISDEEFAIATQMAIDAQLDKTFIPGMKCPDNIGPGSIP